MTCVSQNIGRTKMNLVVSFRIPCIFHSLNYDVNIDHVMASGVSEGDIDGKGKLEFFSTFQDKH